MPVHLGGARYKLYFNRHPRAPPGADNMTPMRMLYADPERSGDAGRIEFEDCEPLEQARAIHYLWPDGSRLNDAEQSLLDDYMIFAPTADPKALLMYSNMGAAAGGQVPFIGVAMLINP